MEEIKKYVIDNDYKIICDFIASVQNNPRKSQRLYFIGKMEIKIILLINRVIKTLEICFNSITYSHNDLGDFKNFDSPYVEYGYNNEFRNIKIYHRLNYDSNNKQHKIKLIDV